MRKLRKVSYSIKTGFKTGRAFLPLVFCLVSSYPVYAQDAAKEEQPAAVQETSVTQASPEKDVADVQGSAESTAVEAQENVATPTTTQAEEAPVTPVDPGESAKEPVSVTNVAVSSGAPAEGIIVNGDTVEFSTEKKEVTAIGNVEVIYKGAKLTCNKLVVNSQTKVGVATGDARLEDSRGVIEGEKIIYDFANKTGTIIDTHFRANPYFGRGEETKKVSDSEFIVQRGILSTCSYDHMHWRIKSKKMDIFPGDKVQTKDDVLYLGPFPVMYLPQLNRSLKDPLLHVQMMPGKTKEWGGYVLTAWRYNLTEDVAGRIYLDYRSNMGVAEGFGVNYDSPYYGKGDFKYYYTQERNKSKQFQSYPVDAPKVFQRYLVRLRHQWTIDPFTNLTAEYWKIADSKRSLYGRTYNFMKDFFYREYETDAQPKSYVSAHRAFAYAGVDFLMQPRVNRWYDTVTEKLPEVKISLPSFHFGNTPFYIDNSTLAGNYNQKAPVPSDFANHSSRIDTTNKLSMPVKVAFVRLTPYVRHEGTYYRKSIDGADNNLFRTIFSSGAEASTKFYRIFNVKSNFLGLDISGVRHIITPTVNYTYQHMPTITASRLTQIDGIDSISNPSNSATLELSNILQTKRDDATVDFFDFLISAPYNFKTRGVASSKLGDIALKLKFLPYNKVALYSDASFCREKSSPAYNTFSNANFEIGYDMGKERNISFGQRYQRKGSNQFTMNFQWRINPKWRFSVYERYVAGHRDPTLGRGLREQEYVIARDLHCWTMEATYNVTRDKGESIFIVFRLKAFPELGFNINQSYHEPKAGELSYTRR